MIDYYDLTLPNIEESIILINNFLEIQSIKGLSKSTYENYNREAIDFFSIFYPSELNQNYLNQYVSDFGNISISLRNRKSSALRIILKYLVKQGYLNCNLKIYYLKNNIKLPTFLSEKEISIMIKKFQYKKHTHRSIWRGRRDYAILLFMYSTGLRASEIVKFKITDLENDWIRVEGGKGKKDRYVPIADKAISALKDYLKYVPMHIKASCSSAFISDNLVNYTRLTLYNYCKNIFNCNPHLFRHTFATHLITNGCNEYVLMELMGHSDLSTTHIYTHIQKENLKNTVDKCFPCIN